LLAFLKYIGKRAVPKIYRHYNKRYAGSLTINMKIHDNEGKTWDRYTLITKDGSVYGFSESPFSPQGYNQYCGNIGDPNGDFEHLGEELELNEIKNTEVIIAILRRIGIIITGEIQLS